MLIMKNFFENVPDYIEESAKIDGCSDFQVLKNIIFPITSPIFSAVLLFNGVWQWNQWTDSYIFVSNDKFKTLQALLVNIINRGEAGGMGSIYMGDVAMYKTRAVQAAAVVIIIIPAAMMYIFLQKYLVRGIYVNIVKH